MRNFYEKFVFENSFFGGNLKVKSIEDWIFWATWPLFHYINKQLFFWMLQGTEPHLTTWQARLGQFQSVSNKSGQSYDPQPLYVIYEWPLIKNTQFLSKNLQLSIKTFTKPSSDHQPPLQKQNNHQITKQLLKLKAG